MSVRARVLLSGAAMLALLLVCGAALGARIYSDPVGDARLGPDMRSVAVSNTSTHLTFRIRFTTAPALRVSQREGWIDMLLLGIDVPPLGPRPIPDGDWLGADFAAGFHGPAKTGVLVRLEKGSQKVVARFPVVTRGTTVMFSIPRRALRLPDVVRVRDGRRAGVERRERGASGGEAGLRPGPRHVPLHAHELSRPGATGTAGVRARAASTR